MTEKKTSSVFISHSSKDDDFVRWLAAELERHGIDVWVDQRHLKPGDSLYVTIGDGLEKADRFIIVLSENAIASHWVNQELNITLNREAREKRHMIIPVLLERIGKMPVFIGDRKFVDFASEKGRDEALKELLGSFGIEFQGSVATGGNKTDAKLFPDQFLPDLRFFVGRELILDAIGKTLDRDHRAVMHDISGLGKTFTAYRYAYENRKRYDRIFLVRATKEEWLESLAKNGEAVDPGLAKLTEQEAKAAGFKDWLERNRNWLVIYDNVDLPEQLSGFVPVTENGDCLFTSNYAEAIMLGTQVGIEKMKGEEAAMLLYSRSVGDPRAVPDLNGKEREAFDKLLEEIDGLPVTLTSTGAVIFKKQWSFERFWTKYNETPSIAWDSEDPHSKYQHKSAGRIFSLIYDELGAAENTGEAVEMILDSVSFISPDEIPEELLQEILKEEYPPYAELQDPEDLWDDVREKLTAYDLLKYDKHKKTFTTHRAIQRVFQRRLEEKEMDACVSLAVVLRGLFPLYDYTNREECEKYYQHVLVLVEHADRFGAETDDTNELYFGLGEYQRLLGNYAQASRFHMRAVEISEKASGTESETRARNLNGLALVYEASGKYDEAIEKLEDAQRIYEKTLGKEHSDYATTLNNLALVYKARGRYDEAIEKYEEAFRIDEKTIGSTHPNYAVRLSNLGEVYRVQGRYDEAIEKYKEALRIDEVTVGREHPSYAVHLNNLAVVYRAQGRYDEAMENHKEALEIREKTLGKEHPDYAQSLNNLAYVYQTRGEYRKALDLYKNALRIFGNTLPGDHPYIAQLEESVEKCGKLVN